MKKTTIFALLSLFFGFSILPVSHAQTPEWSQVLQISTNGFNSVKAVSSDVNNSFMAVTLSATLSYDDLTYTAIGNNDLLLVKTSNSGVSQWVKQFNAQSGGSINPNVIKVDSVGSVFLEATFTGTITIDSKTITSSDEYNAFYAKFDESGNCLWIISYLSTGNGISKIAIDASGNSFLLSKTSKLLKFDSLGALVFEQSYPDRTLQAMAVYGPNLYLGGSLQQGTTNFGTLPLTSMGGYNTGYMVKADLDGVYSDSIRIAGLAYENSSVSDIATDTNGNLIITGCYTQNLIVDTITILNSNNSYYTYIAKLQDNFTAMWAKSSTDFVDVDRDMFSYRVFLDSTQNIYEYGVVNSAITYGSLTVNPETGNQILFKFDPDGTALKGYALPKNSGKQIFVNQAGKLIIGGSNDYEGAPSYGSIYLTQYNNILVQDWEKVSTSATSGYAKINYLKHDTQENIYVQARILGYCNYFGTIIDTNYSVTILSKHTKTGKLLWLNKIADKSPYLFGSAFTLDKNNNVFTVGLFSESLNISDTALSTENTEKEGYVAKYSSEGEFMWAATLNLNSPISDNHTIATDNAGNLLVSGVSAPDNYLMKFDASGKKLWSKSFAMESNYSSLIATDASNNIYLTSEIHLDWMSGSVTIDTVTLNQANDDGSIALFKFNPDGIAQWAKTYGGVQGASYSDGWPCDIKTDSAGFTYLWGWMPNNAIFGSDTLTNPFNYMYSYFLTKIDTVGDVSWAKGVYENKFSFNYGDLLDVDKNGNVFVGGHFKDTISINNTNYIPEGTNDFFAAKYSKTGEFQWIKTIPSNRNIINVLSVYDENMLRIAGDMGENSTLGSFDFIKTGGSNCMIAALGRLPVLNVSTNSINLLAIANSSEIFSITANIGWTATPSESWLTLSDTSGSDNVSISLTVSANPSTKIRTATIIVSGLGVDGQTIAVTQEGKPIGINDRNTNSVYLFPNPVKDELTVNNITINSIVSIYDVNGRLISTKIANSTLEKIDVSLLKKGVYSIIIKDENTHKTNKFVKQ